MPVLIIVRDIKVLAPRASINDIPNPRRGRGKEIFLLKETIKVSLQKNTATNSYFAYCTCKGGTHPTMFLCPLLAMPLMMTKVYSISPTAAFKARDIGSPPE